MQQLLSRMLATVLRRLTWTQLRHICGLILEKYQGSKKYAGPRSYNSAKWSFSLGIENMFLN